MKRQKSTIRVIAEPLLVAVILALIVRTTVRIYSIPSSSMAPTLEAGDHILVTPYGGDEPARGDVIVFRAAADGAMTVKRVIAVPGDLIETRDGRVVISGKTASEPYLAEGTHSGPVIPQLVPASHYFVMGDNRDDSFDSRHWGPLPATRVVGRARMILWSSHDGSLPNSARAASVSRDTRPRHERDGRIFQWIE